LRASQDERTDSSIQSLDWTIRTEREVSLYGKEEKGNQEEDDQEESNEEEKGISFFKPPRLLVGRFKKYLLVFAW
jgi:hypothetical protein